MVINMDIAINQGSAGNRFEYLFTASAFQDGVICGDEMFNFDDKGRCEVWSLSRKEKISVFTLDRRELIVPHCNAVCFGAERYEAGDEFPLLYANIYNNYAGAPDRMEGVCCVYRLTRTGGGFETSLVQIIRVGFASGKAQEPGLWISLPGKGDVRPYGNFTVDADGGVLYAFVMRDADRTTRFFSFPLPQARAGVTDGLLGVPVVTLTEDSLLGMFDIPYSNYLQGACCCGGKIYSLEGFCDEKNRPALRVIGLKERRQVAYIDLWGMGLKNEPEFTDISGDILYYRDGTGKLFSCRLPIDGGNE